MHIEWQLQASCLIFPSLLPCCVGWAVLKQMGKSCQKYWKRDNVLCFQMGLLVRDFQLFVFVLSLFLVCPLIIFSRCLPFFENGGTHLFETTKRIRQDSHWEPSTDHSSLLFWTHPTLWCVPYNVLLDCQFIAKGNEISLSFFDWHDQRRKK